MINVSSISEYMYCPMKTYIRYTEQRKIQTAAMVKGKLTHEIRRGFDELSKRNIWSVDEKMDVKDIFETLFEDVPEFVESKTERYQRTGLISLDIKEKICRDLEEDLKLESWFLTLKTYKILKKTGKSGSDVLDMLFPPLLTEFSIEDPELNLRGQLDRIEIVDGSYYPVEIKSGLPPLKGVWKSDALQIGAYAILMEHEFNRAIPLGFVEYTGACQRRPVLVSIDLREEVLNVLEDIKSMLTDGNIPELTQNPKKCAKCDFSDSCSYSA